MKRRADSDNLNLSFLDAISCGFGAIILLLVMTLLFEPVSLQRTRAEVRALIDQLEQELFDLRGETTRVEEQIAASQTEGSTEAQALARLRADLTRIRGRYEASRETATDSGEVGELKAARQQLTADMRKLLANYRPARDDATVGGIPVDSEYIVFVIDTSGSMFQGPWRLVMRKISETLTVYPKIKGIQVLNDEGRYMFPSYAGKWIPDTPAIRRNIISRLSTWNPYSDSSPVEGIAEAISTFYRADKRISIYVYGDDFPRGQVEAVARYVDRINNSDGNDRRLVRIHGVGFPTQFAGGQTRNALRFANLMRALCERNGGTFVALTTLN